MVKAFNRDMDRYMERRIVYRPKAKKSESFMDTIKNLYERLISFFKHEQSVDLDRLEIVGVTVVNESETPARKLMKNIKKKKSASQPVGEKIDPSLLAETLKHHKLK